MIGGWDYWIWVGGNLFYRSAQGPHSGCATRAKALVCSPKSPIAPNAGSRSPKVIYAADRRRWPKVIRAGGIICAYEANGSPMGLNRPKSVVPKMVIFGCEPLNSPMSDRKWVPKKRTERSCISGTFGEPKPTFIWIRAPLIKNTLLTPDNNSSLVKTFQFWKRNTLLTSCNNSSFVKNFQF